jgi:hypothetical protein
MRYSGGVERRSQRYTVWLPIRIEELEEGMAVSHNASGRGILLVTAANLEVGSTVKIVVQFPPDGPPEKRLTGRVVRVEQNREDPGGLWPHRVALAFDEPVDDLEHALATLAQAGIANVQK